MKVPKVKRVQKRSPSTGSLGSSSENKVLALCDGSAAESAATAGVMSRCLVEVETLEGNFETLRSLRMEIEDQT